MLKLSPGKLGSFLLSNWGWIGFWVILLILELIHLRFLFGGEGLLLAGGDNYTHLFLGRWKLYPYVWDDYYPFGLRSFKITNLFGFELYSQVLGFLSGATIQRLIFFSLYLLKFVGFVKLARLFYSKVSPWALFPAVVLFVFNVFDSLGPLGFYQLLYGAYLPFFLYYFIKIFESEKLNLSDICKLTLISVIASPVNSNTALSATIFIPPFLYFLLNLRRLNRIRVKNLILFAVFWFLANLWWMVPLWAYFQKTGSEILNRSSWFAPVLTGDLFQNFRFIGQWGWYAVHFLYPYYPYSAYFDRPLVIILTYLLVALAFFEATRTEESTNKSSPRFYLLGLSLLSLVLVSGSRFPFGFFYQFLFDYLPGFKIFREPFTKFSEIYVLTICLLLYLFLVRLRLKFGRWRFLLWFLIFLAVGVAVRPGFMAQGLTKVWNGSVRSYRIQIPAYWKEFEIFARDNLIDERVLTSPQLIYGTAWNWPKGFTSADDTAAALLIDKVNFVRAPLHNGVVEERLVKIFFDNVHQPSIGLRLLSLMGVDYLLQENDVDWRYNQVALDPIKSESSLGSFLTVQKTFGFFDENRLERIPNEDPNPYVRQELKDKLLNRPALTLYRLPAETRLPRIYAAPGLIVVPDFTVEKLPRLLDSRDFRWGDVFVDAKGLVLNEFLWAKNRSFSGADADQVLGERHEFGALPSLKFENLNPTKYIVQVTKAPSHFVLAFLERFDPNWKVYLFKSNPGEKEEPWSQLLTKPLEENQHFKVSGFANGWFVDTSNQLQFKSTGGESGTFNYTIVIEYLPQRYFYLTLILLFSMVGLSLAYLVSSFTFRFFSKLHSG